ncbi:MAG: DUF2029 domain-containing protein [Promethearchaeota archaeon]|nr:MAG: DUF2029 domain-containing protein [Candidatus Lokiarchaeota archaeon]
MKFSLSQKFLELKTTIIDDTKRRSMRISFIFVILGLTLIFIILRILIYFFDFPFLFELSKDIDFELLYKGNLQGLVNFYNDVTISGWFQPFPPYYLYFFYFLFLPMNLMPMEVGFYVWDILRFLLVSYVFWKIPEVFQNKIDIFIFYLMSTLSYFFDGYFNNVNFLILFLLFLSYTYYERNKWISGVLFALATFKINSILFLPLLLMIRKIKIKDIIYYLIPFFLICIPYIIFPNYLVQMLDNWAYSSFEIPAVDSVFLELLLKGFSFIWRAVQVSQFMFIGLLMLILLENIKKDSIRKILRVLIIIILTIFNISIAFVNISSIPAF